MSAVINQPGPPASNGQLPRNDLEELLIGEPLTQGYRSSLPLWLLEGSDWLPQMFLMRDVELMNLHPMCFSVLEYFKGGLSGAEFEGPSDPTQPDAPPKPVSEQPEVADFVIEQCKRFWDRGVPGVQEGYIYGWVGCENMYHIENGLLCWDYLSQFCPRDSYLLTLDRNPVGVRVKNIRKDSEASSIGEVDLFLGTEDVPAKGLWYAHRPRWGNFYGQSQYLSAWRPWRRLAFKDGAEQVLDAAFYRFGFNGPVGRYPEEDMQSSAMLPGTQLDSQGRPRRYARDVMRQICEWVKAGAAVGLPSTKYPPEQGGDYKWSLDFPTQSFAGDSILAYIKYLLDQICHGIGVPPELLTSAETGSGYSGRSIPLEAFIQGQQRIADAILHMFIVQVLRPLVRWNFGPQATFDVKVADLLATKRKKNGFEEDKGKGAQPPGGEVGQRGEPPAATPQATPPETPIPFSLDEDNVRRIARRILSPQQVAA